MAMGATPPNILLICVDDLRPELGCYGAAQIKTPNIDKLASGALLFERAFCNVPVCGASRASLLTGILPTPKRFVQFDARIDQDTPDAKTLPQIFKEAGYQTFSVGKVLHHPDDADNQSWSEPAWWPETEGHQVSIDPTTQAKLSDKGRGRIYEMPDVADDAYPDGHIAAKAIQHLRDMKKSGQPFFLACGFLRPHLPFYAPKKYWDLYERNVIELADNRFRPKNAPKQLHSSGEYRSYYLESYKEKSDDFHHLMRHGYFASVSYIDKLIGGVLAELDALGLAQDTIVVLWGDHGWNLGEHEFWGKHNLMLNALRVPLIMRVPGRTNGSKTAAMVESADLFPTLCAIANLPIPKQVQGRSFVTILDHPEVPARDYVYTRFLDGDTVVTGRYAFTRYSGKESAIMLFDHQKDSEENENVAGEPGYKTVIDELEKFLRQSQSLALEYKPIDPTNKVLKKGHAGDE